MTTDPWLLVAQRHFQDMRDVADRDRLVATDEQVSRRRTRIGASVSAVIGAVRGSDTKKAPIALALENEYPFPAPDGTTNLVDAADGATAADVHRDAQRLVNLQPVR